jgi:hypothetical protein
MFTNLLHDSLKNKTSVKRLLFVLSGLVFLLLSVYIIIYLLHTQDEVKNANTIEFILATIASFCTALAGGTVIETFKKK